MPFWLPLWLNERTNMSQELYKRYRPQKLVDVVGQDTAVGQIRKALKAGKFAHAVLLSGPTGTGKTTLMRIIRKWLKCHERDYKEINTANFKGIDTIRELQKILPLNPFSGECRVIGIDECHKLTNDAQNAILKMLEDTPDHVYFILGTTDPHKLLAPVLGRCTEYKLRNIAPDVLEPLIRKVIAAEKLTVSDGVIEEIASAAEGSARKALVILEAVAAEEGEAAQKQAIQITTVNKDLAFKLAGALMGFGGPRKWNDIAAILREMNEEDPEGVRHMILSFARSCLIGKEKKAPDPRNLGRAALLINEFGTPFYESKKAGLAFACFNVMSAGK